MGDDPILIDILPAVANLYKCYKYFFVLIIHGWIFSISKYALILVILFLDLGVLKIPSDYSRLNLVIYVLDHPGKYGHPLNVSGMQVLAEEFALILILTILMLFKAIRVSHLFGTRWTIFVTSAGQFFVHCQLLPLINTLLSHNVRIILQVVLGSDGLKFIVQALYIVSCILSALSNNLPFIILILLFIPNSLCLIQVAVFKVGIFAGWLIRIGI